MVPNEQVCQGVEWIPRYIRIYIYVVVYVSWEMPTEHENCIEPVHVSVCLKLETVNNLTCIFASGLRHKCMNMHIKVCSVQ